MNDLLDQVEFLVAVGSDVGNQDTAVPDALLDSDGWLRRDETEHLWMNIEADTSCIAPGIRALLRDAGVDAKLGLCQLYFRMINSAGCPVRHRSVKLWY